MKTYYYRLRSVRLATLQKPDNAATYLPKPEAPSPVFAKLDFNSMSEGVTLASSVYPNGIPVVTVRVGDIAVDINNGADPAIIEDTLRLIREIC